MGDGEGSRIVIGRASSNIVVQNVTHQWRETITVPAAQPDLGAQTSDVGGAGGSAMSRADPPR